MAADRAGETILATHHVLLGGNVDVISGARATVRCKDNQLVHCDDADLLRPFVEIEVDAKAYDANSGITSAVVLVNELDSWQFPPIVPRDCRLLHASVGCMHISASPPTDWLLEVSKNMSGTADSSFTFFLNSGMLTWEPTVALPSAGLDFTAGDSIGFQLTGSSLDGIIAQIKVVLKAIL